MSLQYPEQFQQLLVGSLCAVPHVVSYLQHGMFSHILASKLLIKLSTVSSNITFFSIAHHPLFLLSLVHTFILVLIGSQCNCCISMSPLILGMPSGSMFISSFFLINPPTHWKRLMARQMLQKNVLCFMLGTSDYFSFCSCGGTGRYFQCLEWRQLCGDTKWFL